MNLKSENQCFIVQSSDFSVIAVNLLFCLSLTYCSIYLALWPSVGKELSPWPFTCAVFILVPSKL